MQGKIGRVVALTTLVIGITAGTAAAQAGPTTIVVPPGTVIVQPGQTPIVIEPGQRVILQPGSDVTTSYAYTDRDPLPAGYSYEYTAGRAREMRYFLDEQNLPPRP
jgi:hypothetical protein